MPDPTSVSAGASTAGATGTGVVLDQALVAAIAAAVQTAVSQASQQFQTQIADGMKSLSENVNKLAIADSTDSDSGYLVRSSIDPATSQRNTDAYREAALADCVDFRKACDALILRKISQDTDHHGAIPPIAPRSATGPGTSAA
ncbi:MAG: hypothetical protein WA459_00185 [Stellaceae bacterium]